MKAEVMYERADNIINAVCKAGNLSWVELMTAPKSLKINILRGLACYLAWEMNIHARIMAKFIGRSRSNIINMGQKYRGFVQSKDKSTMSYYNEIKKYLI